MKQVLLIVLITGYFQMQTIAQSGGKDVDAKVAYLMAEEEFGAGQYQSCITYLSQASAKLGMPNSKILYLKIMAERELSLQDKSYLASVKNTISAFEKAPDVKSFNEEKYLEVMKLKLLIEKEAVQAEHEKQAKVEKANEEKRAFKAFSKKGWALGASIDDMRKVQPSFFAKAQKSQNSDGDVYSTLADMQSVSENGIKMLYAKNNIVYGIYDALFIFEDDANFSKSLNAINNTVLKSLTEEFGFSPQEKTEDASTKNFKSINKTYTWERDGKSVVVQLNQSTFSKKSFYGTGSMLITDKNLAK